MPTVVTITTFGGEDIVIPFPDGSPPPTTGDLLRELATRVPNRRSSFRLWVNDSECAVRGDDAKEELTQVVDLAKDVTLIYEQYKAFDTTEELRAAVDSWTADSNDAAAKGLVCELYGSVIGSWDVSHITDMSHLFDGASEFDDEEDIGRGGEMFEYNRKSDFNDDLSGWDTSNVTDMCWMFHAAWAFNGDVSGWDTSNVADMCGMFSLATTFNGDVSGWDTSKVTDMREMFWGASAFNCDLSGWDTSRVTRMANMFSGASAFDGDVSGWDTSCV
jgi:surface protein